MTPRGAPSRDGQNPAPAPPGFCWEFSPEDAYGCTPGSRLSQHPCSDDRAAWRKKSDIKPQKEEFSGEERAQFKARSKQRGRRGHTGQTMDTEPPDDAQGAGRGGQGGHGRRCCPHRHGGKHSCRGRPSLGLSRTYTKPGQPPKCSAWGGGHCGAHGATWLVPGDGTRGCARAPGCCGMLQVSDL